MARPSDPMPSRPARRSHAALATILAIAAGAAACAHDPSPFVWSPPGSPSRAEPLPAFDDRDEDEMAAWRADWNFQDPAASEAAFRASLAVEPAPDRALELRTQIGRALGLQQRFDEARAELDAVASAIGAGGAPRVRVLLDLERGRVARSSGDPAAARGPFERAFELACATGLDYLAVDAAHMLGIVASGAAASEWNRRALAIAGASHDAGARGWGAVIANNEGWNRFDAGEYDAALELFERALVLRRERPDQVEPIRVARWCVARAHRALGRLEEALAEQRALLAEREAANAPDGYVYEEIGECLLRLDRGDESIAYFARAHELLSQDPWLVANEAERLERLARLGR